MPQIDLPIERTAPETNLAHYLTYYVTQDAPGYAVLVTGAWGIGKTYQVKKIIPEPERYFVSLYGLDSVESIHDAVLASCLSNEKLREYAPTVGEVTKAAGQKYAIVGLATSVGKAVLRQRLTPDRTIIFDDLERSPLWEREKQALLGAINYYVEQRGFRVVVICYDERVEEDLTELKEKTFGHTVRAMPQTEAALDQFITQLQDQTARKFIRDKRPIIREIWTQSGQSSLRILKHVINDVVRLHKTLEPRHLANEEAIVHVLRFFCALDFEVRAGRLNRELLVNRQDRYISETVSDKAVEEKKPLLELVSRYPSSDLRGNILSDELVVGALIEGRFDAALTAASLDQAAYFIKASEAPPWLIVMKFDELDDETLNHGIARMQRQFDERSVTEMGEFLHIAALRLMMAEQNISGRSMAEEADLCLKYVDDLLNDGRLPPKPLQEHFSARLGVYGGYSYWLSDATKPHFKAIHERIKQARDQALEATFPEHIGDILRQLKEGSPSIIRTISPTNDNADSLAHIPILAQIPPGDFVDTWLSGPRERWHNTTTALNNRYAHGQLGRDLSSERPWLIEIERELNAHITAATGFDAYRLKRIKPEVFNKLQIVDEPV